MPLWVFLRKYSDLLYMRVCSHDQFVISYFGTSDTRRWRFSTICRWRTGETRAELDGGLALHCTHMPAAWLCKLLWCDCNIYIHVCISSKWTSRKCCGNEKCPNIQAVSVIDMGIRNSRISMTDRRAWRPTGYQYSVMMWTILCECLLICLYIIVWCVLTGYPLIALLGETLSDCFQLSSN